MNALMNTEQNHRNQHKYIPLYFIHEKHKIYKIHKWKTIKYHGTHQINV